MSESMVERVTIAVRTAFTDAELNNPRISFEQLTDIIARAAIEAMREPTDLMARVGLRENTLNGGAIWPDQAWKAMIDIALSSGAEKPHG